MVQTRRGSQDGVKRQDLNGGPGLTGTNTTGGTDTFTGIRRRQAPPSSARPFPARGTAAAGWHTATARRARARCSPILAPRSLAQHPASTAPRRAASSGIAHSPSAHTLATPPSPWTRVRPVMSWIEEIGPKSCNRGAPRPARTLGTRCRDAASDLQLTGAKRHEREHPPSEQGPRRCCSAPNGNVRRRKNRFKFDQIQI